MRNGTRWLRSSGSAPMKREHKRPMPRENISSVPGMPRYDQMARQQLLKLWIHPGNSYLAFKDKPKGIWWWTCKIRFVYQTLILRYNVLERRYHELYKNISKHGPVKSSDVLKQGWSYVVAVWTKMDRADVGPTLKVNKLLIRALYEPFQRFLLHAHRTLQTRSSNFLGSQLSSSCFIASPSNLSFIQEFFSPLDLSAISHWSPPTQAIL